jgi:hypothetical protein
VLDRPPLVARVESIEGRKCARVGRDGVVWCGVVEEVLAGDRRLWR